jgi:hypothetical protein
VSAIHAHVEQTRQHPVNHVIIQRYTTRQDGRRCARFAHRKPLAWRAAYHDAQDEDGHRQRGASLDGNGEGEGASVGVRRMTERIPLPHNSLFVMGLAINARWMHSVHTDKRPEETKDPADRGPHQPHLSSHRHLPHPFLNGDSGWTGSRAAAAVHLWTGRDG